MYELKVKVSNIKDLHLQVEWIDVNEKLPEKEKVDWCDELIAPDVMICYLENSKYKISIAYYENGFWWKDESKLNVLVEFWMRLPEAP